MLRLTTIRLPVTAAVTVLTVGCGSPAGTAPLGSDGGPRVPAVIANAQQLLLVTTPDWDTVGGELRRYERTSVDAAWTAVGEPVAIVVGRSGTAWDPDIALAPPVPGPMKVEGDGRSPAGAFSLGSAFGLATPQDAAWLKLPYLQETATLECVDDARSAHYNQLVHRDRVSRVDWTSSEKMVSVGEAYRWGVVVEYNTSPAVRDHGSCIFLHISPIPGQGTAGCTAMAAPALDGVMRWLDLARRPVLVQLPKAARAALSGPWELPA